MQSLRGVPSGTTKQSKVARLSASNRRNSSGRIPPNFGELRLRLAMTVCVLFAFAGCAYVSPAIQDFNIVSVEEEKAIGFQIHEQIQKEMSLSSDSTLNLRVKQLGERLESALPQHSFDYQFHVVDNKTPNAFTIPGGSIYVHTGLLKFVDDDNQLAGVLAHEIGHMYERHPAKSLSRAYGIEQLSNLIFRNNKNQFRTIAFQLAGGSVLTKYSREDELEADFIGFQLLRRAGMQTNGLKRFLIKLNQLQGSSPSIPFMSTHPPTAERIHRLDMLERGNTAVIASEAKQSKV